MKLPALYLTLVLIGVGYSLNCRFGTPDNLQTCTTGIGQDSCISATFKAPFTLSSTEIYTCGTCAVFNDTSLSVAYSNISCCNSSDYCQTIFNTSDNLSCDFITNEESCQLRSDCYWCGGTPSTTLNGFGLCKSWIGFEFGPCWAIPLVLPPPLCDEIVCQPADPAYTVEELTLEYLIEYGFPALGENATLIGLDVLSRIEQTRMLNDTFEMCIIDQDLQEWCGFNNTSPFKYCVVSEKWPQTDIHGWLSNTTFSNNANLSPLFPSFCACPIAGRAYYIPVRRIAVNFSFIAPACRNEHVMLALFILLIVATCIAFLFVLWDTAILAVYYCQGRKGFSLGKTLPVKICLILYFLLTIPNQFLMIFPVGYVAGLILKTLGLVLLQFAFALATFAFIELLVEARLFGSEKISFGLVIYKWLFIMIFGFLLICCVGLLSATAYYLLKVSQFRDTNLADFAHTGLTGSSLFKATCLLIHIVEALIIILTGILVIFVTYTLMKKSNGSRMRGLKDLIARDMALLFALIVSIPQLFLLITQSIYSSYIMTGDLPSPNPSLYLTTQAMFWLTSTEFLTELLLIIAIAYAMRTVVRKSWVVGQFKYVFNIDVNNASENICYAQTAEKTFDSRL